jgi:Uncharacterized protein conserved in bacteria (DUF2252)
MPTKPKEARGDRLFSHRRSRAERRAKGKSLRDACPREAHAVWKAPAGRPDPVSLVLEADKGRIVELLPLRHGRMAVSPFTLFRGSALNMAVDLATTPVTGVRVQCCGDAHLGNFRGLGTPERRVIFAINDLDETLPGPWEWDLKRLTASFVVACRNNGLIESTAKDAVLACVRSYREHMREFSEMNPIDLWYFNFDSDMLLAAVDDPELRKRAIKRIDKERTRRVEEDLFPAFNGTASKRPVIEDQPPTIFHWKGHKPGKIHPDNLSGDKEQECFSDGLTEELLNSLTEINELQVAARTSAFSFKGKDEDIGTIARKLNVGAILEGSVRRSEHTVRITAQLVNAVTGFHLWSKTYDRDLRCAETTDRDCHAGGRRPEGHAPWGSRGQSRARRDTESRRL